MLRNLGFTWTVTSRPLLPQAPFSGANPLQATRVGENLALAFRLSQGTSAGLGTAKEPGGQEQDEARV